MFIGKGMYSDENVNYFLYNLVCWVTSVKCSKYASKCITDFKGNKLWVELQRETILTHWINFSMYQK